MSPYNDPTYKRNRKSILAGEPDCAICGKAKADTVDHIVPLDNGGDHSLDNLRPACGSCNYRLGAIHRNKKTAQRIQNRNNAMNVVEVRPCQTCGTMFTPDWRNEARGGGKYCSRECFNPPKPQWSYIVKWDCRICGKPMATDIITTNEEPKPRHRHTCSTECAYAYTKATAYHATYTKHYPGQPMPDSAPIIRPDTWQIHVTYHEPETETPEKDSWIQNETTPSPHSRILSAEPDSVGLPHDLDYRALTGRIEPRLVTPRSTELSLGPALADFAHKYMKLDLMPWQRTALDGQLAVDGNGDLLFREALVSTGRQQGKSVALRALAGWFLVDEARRRGRPVNVLLVANKLERSIPLFRELAFFLEEKFGATVRWAAGSQQVSLPDGSTLRVAAAKDNVHGMTLDLILVDEVWDVAPSVIYHALRPSMIAVKNPLLSMWSTAGDESSTLMMKLREQAIAAIDAGRPGRLFLAEWSPPPGVDPDDRRWWPWANPALGTTVTWDALEAAADSGDQAAFLRAHLNLWIAAAKSWLPIGTWEPLAHEARPAGGILSVEQSVDESRYVGVRAAQADGLVHVTVEFTVDNADACWREIARVMADPTVALTVTPGLEVLAPMELRRRMTIVGYGELLKFTPTVRSMILEGRVRHDGTIALAEHTNRAVAIKTQNSIVLSSQKSPGPIELARAMVWAVALAAKPASRQKPAFAAG